MSNPIRSDGRQVPPIVAPSYGHVSDPRSFPSLSHDGVLSHDWCGAGAKEEKVPAVETLDWCDRCGALLGTTDERGAGWLVCWPTAAWAKAHAEGLQDGRSEHGPVRGVSDLPMATDHVSTVSAKGRDNLSRRGATYNRLDRVSAGKRGEVFGGTTQVDSTPAVMARGGWPMRTGAGRDLADRAKKVRVYNMVTGDGFLVMEPATTRPVRILNADGTTPQKRAKNKGTTADSSRLDGMDAADWCSASDAMAFLGCSVATLGRLCKDGALVRRGSIRDGSYRVAELLAR